MLEEETWCCEGSARNCVMLGHVESMREVGKDNQDLM